MMYNVWPKSEFGYPEDTWEETFKNQVCHPSIWNDKTNKLLKDFIDNLAKLYQSIGEYEQQDVYTIKEK